MWMIADTVYTTQSDLLTYTCAHHNNLFHEMKSLYDYQTPIQPGALSAPQWCSQHIMQIHHDASFVMPNIAAGEWKLFASSDEFESSALAKFLTFAEYTILQKTAIALYHDWGGSDELNVNISSIQLSDLRSSEHVNALRRVLDCDNNGFIKLNGLLNCLIMLRHGSLIVKVAMLCKFVSSEGVKGQIPKSAFKRVPQEVLENLQLLKDGLESLSSVSYPELLSVFTRSACGEYAVSIFCNHILALLLSKQMSTDIQVKEASHPKLTKALDVAKLWSTEIAHQVSLEHISFACLTAMQIALWIYNYRVYTKLGAPKQICVAKGFGINIRIMTILLFLSMARTTQGLLFTTRILRNFSLLGISIEIHSFCGVCVFLHSLGHSFAHMAYRASDEMTELEDLQQHSLLRGSTWEQTHRGGDSITGYILLVMIIAMVVAALLRGKDSSSYKWFTMLHLMYVLWLLFIYIHVPTLWPYFVSIAALFGIERAYDYWFQTVHFTLKNSRNCSPTVTYVSIPKMHRSAPGTYYRMKVPSISPIEWHPFSNAGSESSHHLGFFIAKVGDWTSSLHDLVANEEARDNATILVQGPFYSTTFFATEYKSKSVLLVASGIGITPFFSQMVSKVNDEQAFDLDQEVYSSLFDEDIADRSIDMTSMRPYQTPGVLHVIWSIRGVQELMFYLNYIFELTKFQIDREVQTIVISIYVTGVGNSDDMSYLFAQLLALLSLPKPQNHIKVVFGRPNLDEIVDKALPQAVYYCGGTALRKSLEYVCAKKHVPFSAENFDASPSALLNMQKGLSSLLASKKANHQKSKVSPN